MIGYPYADSNLILQRFFETAPLFMGVVELLEDDLRHLTANPATARYWNKSMEQMKGLLVSEMFPRAVLEFLLPYYREVALERKTVSFEQQHSTPTGTVYFNVILSFVSHPAGSPPIISYIVQDITEKRTIEAHLVAAKVELEERVRSRTLELEAQKAKMEESLRNELGHHRDLEKALRARDEFVSIASHELKTPLTSLKLQTEMTKRYLRLDALDAEKVTKFFAQTETQLVRITRLVDDMLDISRITTGKLSMHPDRADLVAIIRDVVERLAGVLKLAGCEVTTELPAQCPGRWDPFRIEQVLINLLTNAIKFGHGSPIHIRLQRLPEEVMLSIKDQGRGIAPEDQARIFERFERAISNNEVSGLGLGLYISQQIVHMHGGSIHVESQLNEGATFTVRLPLE